MRKYSALLLAPALAALLTVGFVASDGARGAPDRRHGTTSGPSPNSSQGTTPTNPRSEPLGTVQPVAASEDPVSPPAAPAPELSDGGCNAAAVRDAIADSDAIDDDATFEISYLNCDENYGWARIVADYGEGATVLLKGSGADISLLNLGSSVCALDSGIPAGVADQLSPPGSNWRGECGL